MDTSILRSSLSKDNQLYELSNLKYGLKMKGGGQHQIEDAVVRGDPTKFMAYDTDGNEIWDVDFLYDVKVAKDPNASLIFHPGNPVQLPMKGGNTVGPYVLYALTGGYRIYIDSDYKFKLDKIRHYTEVGVGPLYEGHMKSVIGWWKNSNPNLRGNYSETYEPGGFGGGINALEVINDGYMLMGHFRVYFQGFVVCLDSVPMNKEIFILSVKVNSGTDMGISYITTSGSPSGGEEYMVPKNVKRNPR